MVEVPPGQKLQEVAPPEAVNFPRGQGWHCDELVDPAAALKVPDGHCSHTAALVAPMPPLLKVPGAQGVQIDNPPVLNVPAAQRRHAATSGGLA